MIDFRYHALTIAAVFVALALGLLLGMTLGDTNLISNARGGLENSLKSDLDDARQQASDREKQLENQNEFIGAAYPKLVRGELVHRRVVTIGSAKVAQSTLKAVTGSVEPAGAEVTYIAQLVAQPRYAEIAKELGVGRLIPARTPKASEAEQLGRAVGRRLARGRNATTMRRLVFSRFSGNYSRASLVTYARQAAENQRSDSGKVFDGFERGIVAGLAQRSQRVAGVESSTTTPSNIAWYNALGLSTVDNVEQFSGHYSLVAIFNGAKGDFGTKESAGSLVPQIGL
jgi:hypothetical protein